MKKVPMIVILILVMLLTACGKATEAAPIANPAPAVDVVIAEGHLIPNQSQYLVFPVRGRVAEILVSEGDSVDMGQVLIRLGDSEQAQVGLAAAQLELTQAQQDYDALIRTADLGHAQAWQAYIDAQKVRAAAQLAWDRLDLSAIEIEIDNTQAEVTSRQTDLDEAQTDFDKYRFLPVENVTRQTYEDSLRTAQIDYDTAVQKLEDLTHQRDAVQATLDAARATEAEALRDYDNTDSGADVDQLALAQARLDAAQAQVSAAQAALDNYELKAPFNGTIADIDIRVGEWAGPEAWVAALVDTSAWYVETSDLSELDVVEIGVGQSVEVTADALPDVVMTGVVESISAAPRIQGSDILYTAQIRMDEVDPSLRWGMTMEVTFTPQEANR